MWVSPVFASARRRPAGTQGRARAGRGRSPARRCHPRPSSAPRTTRAPPAAGPRARARRGCAGRARAARRSPALSSPARVPKRISRVIRRHRPCAGCPRKPAKSTTLKRLPRMFATPRNQARVVRHRHDGRHRDDLAGVAEADQPPLAAARQPQPRRLDLRRRLGRETRRQLLLERAEVELGGAGHGRSAAVRRAR